MPADPMATATTTTTAAASAAASSSSSAPDDGGGEHEHFHFPFEPYTIQSALMKQLLQTIDDRRVGIFESPTGTVRALVAACMLCSPLIHRANNLYRANR